MLDTSRDILNITLSAAVGILAFLLAWLLIYCIRVMHTVSTVTRKIEDTLQLAEQVLIVLRDRARDLGSVLPLIIKAVDKLATYIGEKRANAKVKNQKSE